jgi:hypothetical protein
MAESVSMVNIQVFFENDRTFGFLPQGRKVGLGDRYFKNTSPSTMLIIIFLSINYNATR